MNGPDKYRAVQWRKALERRGWINVKKGVPRRRAIEFHILHRGQLYSGRCVVGYLDAEDNMRPGSLGYVFYRQEYITEGVWRLSPGGELGWIVRSFP